MASNIGSWLRARLRLAPATSTTPPTRDDASAGAPPPRTSTSETSFTNAPAGKRRAIELLKGSDRKIAFPETFKKLTAEGKSPEAILAGLDEVTNAFEHEHKDTHFQTWLDLLVLTRKFEARALGLPRSDSP